MCQQSQRWSQAETWHELICGEAVGGPAQRAGSLALLCLEDAGALVAQRGFITKLAPHR